MTFFVETEEGAGELGIDTEGIFRLAALAALEYTGCPYECEADLKITDDAGIKELNRTYRGIDRETDVLSFPMLDFPNPGDFSGIGEDEAGAFDPETGELLLGDIVVSADRVRAQAEAYGHSLKREFAFLIVHSMLHLQGFDHMQEEERMQMEKAQDEILKGIRIGRNDLEE